MKNPVVRPVVAVTLLLVAPLLLGAQGGDVPPVTTTVQRMDAILDALGEIAPAAIDDEAFADPSRREVIRANLDGIAADARQVSAHGADHRSLGFRRIGETLAEDAELALARFDAGDFRGARYLVGRFADLCFACHSRLPGAYGPGIGADFLDRPGIAALPVRERMTLAVVSRQFDTALTLGEMLLADPGYPAGALDLQGVLDDYLRIGLRVHANPERTRVHLAGFLGRDDLPDHLRQVVTAWVEALEVLDPHPYDRPRLEVARERIDEGRRWNRYPADRRGEVHFLTASGLLHQFLESSPTDPAEIAEAYALLGEIETTLRGTSRSVEAEIYLESAIRTDPGSETARGAFARLEEFVVEGYTGTAGIQVPAGVRERLEELRDLAAGDGSD